MRKLPGRWTVSDACLLLVVVLLIGYLLMSRTFAHWRFGPLYIGELALAFFLFFKWDSLVVPWCNALLRPSRLSAVAWWLVISVMYGLVHCVIALFYGPPMLAGEIFVFHLYPLFLLPGLWLATKYPDFLPRAIPVLAWIHGIYGVLFITILNPMGLTSTEEDLRVIGWFGHPTGAAILVLGLLAYERNWHTSLVPILLNMLILIGMQRRAEWIAFFAAVTLWAFMSGQVRRLVLMTCVAVAFLVIGLMPDVRFPSPSFRGESVSTREVIGRLIAPFSETLANELTPKADSHAATASWRSDFWASIWDEVHASQSTALFGLGFHYPLWQLHPEDDLDENPVRTPHSIFMFVLGYSGWVGVLICVGLQTVLARLLWRTYRETGDPFGFCLWVLAILWAVVDPMLERPFGAIPVYLFMGMSLARGFEFASARKPVSRATSAPVFPASPMQPSCT